MPTNHMISKLRELDLEGRPINIAVLGAGWFGTGLVGELMNWPGMNPRIIADRNIDKGISAYRAAGVPAKKIIIATTVSEARAVHSADTYMVCSDVSFINEIKGIDLVYDALGNILTGAQAALSAFRLKRHYVTVSAELDSAVGYVLNKIAKHHGVIYSISDGDQPGVLGRLIPIVKSMGFEITVAGNCKGFIDRYATPESVMPWVKDGHNPRMICSFTDGTKQCVELAVTANYAGLTPDVRGMHGIHTTKKTLVDDITSAISQEGVVEYTMGIDGVDQGGGVFVIGKRVGKSVAMDLNYLKKNVGPYYLFFTDHHLCYFEAPTSIAEVALYETATLAQNKWNADVVSIAKTDLKKGDRLDGIGGFKVFGSIDKAEIMRKENLLPIGLTEFAVLKSDVKKDTPITYSMVEMDKNLVVKLREIQDDLTGKEIVHTEGEKSGDDDVLRTVTETIYGTELVK